MLETTYASILLDANVPTVNPGLAQAARGGLFHACPELRDLIGSKPLHAWAVGGLPAPDGAFGFDDDTAAVAVEAKRAYSLTLSNATNWHSRATLRRLYETYGHPGDPLSRSVYDAYLDTDPGLDAPHTDADCRHQPCEAWAWVRNRAGIHRPVVHQGDTYVATSRWVPDQMTMSTPSALGHLLLAPTEESASKFREGLVTKNAWMVAPLPAALSYWEAAARTEHVPGLDRLIAATRAFLPADVQALLRRP